jgi:hypothetical protein
MHEPRFWRGDVAVLLFLLLGVGFVSAVLPGETEQAGYYDGDGDDAAVAPERFALVVDLALTAAPTTQLTRTSHALGGSAARVSPPLPGRDEPPALRSPPAA